MTRTVVDNVAKREEWMVEVCGIELWSVPKIMSELKLINKGSTVTFYSPWKHHQHNKTVPELDFYKNVLCCIIF
jgi:hypothetical protein